MTVLVTGATGTVGGATLVAACERGLPVRALVRSPERADDLRGYDAEIAVGSYDNATALDHALEGVEAALLVSPLHEHQLAWETSFVDAARRAGTHVVKLAALGWSPHGRGRSARTHAAVVHHMVEAHVPHTVLAPTSFQQNLVRDAAQIAAGVLPVPGGVASVAHIDVRDIAAVATVVLADPASYSSRSLKLTGPEALSYDEVAAILSEVTGHPVRYDDIDPGDFAQSLAAAGAPDYVVGGLVEIWAGLRDGASEQVTQTVQEVLGRPATPLRAFLADHPALLRSV